MRTDRRRKLCGCSYWRIIDDPRPATEVAREAGISSTWLSYLRRSEFIPWYADGSCDWHGGSLPRRR